MRNDHFNPALHQNVKPGDMIAFGAYPQTANGTDRTPITWRVLQHSGMEWFVLSEYILDCKRYHAEFVDTTWRDCDVRRWLNDEFFHVAFDANEREFVRTTRCTDNGEGKPDTEDRVFLLSVAEVKTLTDPHGKDALARRRTVGTEFARAKKADGCRLYVYDKSKSADYITENGEKHGCSWWWLRTQPDSSSRACFVGTQGSIRSYGRVNLAYYGVRPALKLDLQR